jgi:hypothetical protein
MPVSFSTSDGLFATVQVARLGAGASVASAATRAVYALPGLGERVELGLGLGLGFGFGLA